LKLLLVEDEYYTRQGIMQTTPWPKLGITEVACASNGQEGLRMLSMEPDILLTDIRMPFITGLDIATQLRRNDPNSQIIIMSSYSDKEYLFKAISLSTVAYIEKPIQLDELAAAIHQAVVRRKRGLRLVEIESHERETPRFTALPDPETPSYSHATRMVLKAVAERYADPELSVESLADIVHLNAVYLGSTFKDDTGLNIRPVINAVRMEAACALLRDTNLPITEIAAQTGFNSANYFSKQFRQHMGVAPNDYREQPYNESE